MEVLDRFNQYVSPTPTRDGCILWTGCFHLTDGYGQFHFRGRPVRAHRVAWILSRGEIKDGLCVLHKCDVRACVNVKHLFLGTRADNMRDCISKGRARYAHGESHYKSKLTKKQVNKIRELRKKGVSGRELARKYGVSHTNINNIVDMKIWRTL